MVSRPLNLARLGAVGGALALALAACDKPNNAAPPEGTEGAAGVVTEPNAGATVNPVTPATPGGPAGQTPAYGKPGGAPTEVLSEPK